MVKLKVIYPLEIDETVVVIQWAGMQLKKWPCLKRLHHISNEGARGWIGQRIFAAIKKWLNPPRIKEGIKGGQSGVADLFLPWPVSIEGDIVSLGDKDYRGFIINGHAGLYIEMKRNRFAYGKTAKSWEKALKPDQRDFLQDMREAGYRAEVCYGADEAIKVIQEYLEQ
jgi:hypothetical protein